MKGVSFYREKQQMNLNMYNSLKLINKNIQLRKNIYELEYLKYKLLWNLLVQHLIDSFYE